MGQVTKNEQLYDLGNGNEGTVEFGHSDYPRLTVTVFIRSSFDGKSRTAEVNWSAIGSVDPMTAKIYAHLIDRAADYAAGFNHGSAS